MKGSRYFTFVDLFAGIGGFRLALTRQGGYCLGFSEIDKDAISTYCKNFGEISEHNFGDIRKIVELPPHDLLTAGVPCQSWSIAGKNLGFDDDRGQLWNDTIYLLQKFQPKSFIFENVKGLVDPRNRKSLSYILERIAKAGYYADFYVINSFDYGVLQHRIRMYIIGFRNQEHFYRFQLPHPIKTKQTLGDLLGIKFKLPDNMIWEQKNLFGDDVISSQGMSLSSRQGFNDYFLFNDLRNGHTTIHSWDIIETTERQKDICSLLLKNRRKSHYGKLDGNPLSLKHFQMLDSTITQDELSELVELGILNPEEYLFNVENHDGLEFTEEEKTLLENSDNGKLVIDDLKVSRSIKQKEIAIFKTLKNLKAKGIISCQEIRYDFKNTKISTGLFGVSRIFLPSSYVFPTLVSSDTNDYIALEDIKPTNFSDYKQNFIETIYKPGKYRKISKAEACLMQGFPENFILPESRIRWMKLIGNSVSVPVIAHLCKAIIDTGVFDATA